MMPVLKLLSKEKGVIEGTVLSTVIRCSVPRRVTWELQDWWLVCCRGSYFQSHRVRGGSASNMFITRSNEPMVP